MVSSLHLALLPNDDHMQYFHIKRQVKSKSHQYVNSSVHPLSSGKCVSHQTDLPCCVEKSPMPQIVCNVVSVCATWGQQISAIFCTREGTVIDCHITAAGFSLKE